MPIKNIRFVPATLLLTAAMTLYGTGEKDADSKIGREVIVDHYGRSLSFEGEARRIVSLAPGITETIYALGYGERLVGRSEYCDYPPEVSELTVAGTLTAPDVEVLLSLNPDLIIAGTHFPEAAVEQLEDFDLPVVVFMGQESFEGTYDGVIRPVAAALGDREAGERLIAEMDVVRNEALGRVGKFPFSPRVYYVVGFGEGGDWTAGGDTFIGEIVELAGGRNIADEVSGWSFSVEALIEADPDLIIVPAWALEVFPNSPIYEDLRASRSGRIFAVDENIIVRQGPRLAAGFSDLVDIIGSVF